MECCRIYIWHWLWNTCLHRFCSPNRQIQIFSLTDFLVQTLRFCFDRFCGKFLAWFRSDLCVLQAVDRRMQCLLVVVVELYEHTSGASGQLHIHPLHSPQWSLHVWQPTRGHVSLWVPHSPCEAEKVLQVSNYMTFWCTLYRNYLLYLLWVLV